jgi:hypothetical protein
MTVFNGDDAAAAARSAEVRELIGRTQSQDVLLTVLSAMDLCALGGARQAVFDEAPARAWAALRPSARKKMPPVVFDGLEERGLLIRQAPTVPLAAGGQQPQSPAYAFAPKLGTVMAARARPGLVVVCELEQLPTRHPRLYGLGDEQDPVRAVVLETPEGPPPGDFPHLRKAGPLAWFYRYDLVSKARAAEFLAGWALLRSETRPDSARLITVLRDDRDRLLTVQTLAVRSDDGKSARLDGGGPEYDQAGLAGVMSGLFTAPR